MSLIYYVMLAPVANVKTLLVEKSCSPLNCCHRIIAEQSLCQQLKSSMENLVDPYNMTVS